MKKVFVAVLVVATVIVVSIPFLKIRMQNQAEVRNQAGQMLRFVTVSVGGETTRLENVEPRESRVFPFSIQSDGHFRFEGQLADGTPLNGNFGYVTNGMYGEPARFTIMPKGTIEFRQGQYSAE